MLLLASREAPGARVRPPAGDRLCYPVPFGGGQSGSGYDAVVGKLKRGSAGAYAADSLSSAAARPITARFARGVDRLARPLLASILSAK